MRVLLDTNVLISYLLPSGRHPGIVHQIVDAAFAGKFQLLVAEHILDEFRSTVANKPYFAARITAKQVESFVEALREIAEVLLHSIGEVPVVVRDPDDDVILAIAVLGGADYLITGDQDLLAIREAMSSPQIIRPTEFLTAVLRGE